MRRGRGFFVKSRDYRNFQRSSILLFEDKNKWDARLRGHDGGFDGGINKILARSRSGGGAGSFCGCSGIGDVVRLWWCASCGAFFWDRAALCLCAARN